MHLLSCSTSVFRKLNRVVFELMMFVDVETVPCTNRKVDIKIAIKDQEYYIYKRPFADNILEWLLQYRIDIGFWTHQPRRLARTILRKAFPKVYKCLCMLWSRRSCIVYEETYVKPLAQLKKKGLFVDFNKMQLMYDVHTDARYPVLIDTEGNLKQIFWFLRRRLRQPYISMPRGRSFVKTVPPVSV